MLKAPQEKTWQTYRAADKIHDMYKEQLKTAKREVKQIQVQLDQANKNKS